jgi:hypothetical protein
MRKYRRSPAPLLTNSAFFAELIAGNSPLPGAPEPHRVVAAELLVLGFSATYTRPPHSETGGFHLPAHEGDDGRLRQSELRFDGLEGRAIFPGHFYDAVYVLFRHIEMILCWRKVWSVIMLSGLLV